MGIREVETRGAYIVTVIEKKKTKKQKNKKLRIRDTVNLVFMEG